MLLRARLVLPSHIDRGFIYSDVVSHIVGNQTDNRGNKMTTETNKRIRNQFDKISVDVLALTNKQVELNAQLKALRDAELLAKDKETLDTIDSKRYMLLIDEQKITIRLNKALDKFYLLQNKVIGMY